LECPVGYVKDVVSFVDSLISERLEDGNKLTIDTDSIKVETEDGKEISAELDDKEFSLNFRIDY
jgi:hypothetical protein